MLRTSFKVTLHKQTAWRMGVQSMADLSLRLLYDAPKPLPISGDDNNAASTPHHPGVTNSSVFSWSVGLCPELSDQPESSTNADSSGRICVWLGQAPA